MSVHLVLIAALGLVGCTGGANVQPVRAQQPVAVPTTVDHSALTDLLQTHVDAAGMVDYAALQANHDDALAPYLQQLAETDPANLSEEARLAFWINAYNALTLKLIVDHYPVERIKDITPAGGPSIPKLNAPWHVEVGEVGGQMRTLDEIEHEIIRERFDEPRIHFALVCAAVSCPRLRREAFTGARLDAQLDDQARRFLRTRAKNQIPAGDDAIRLSRIFKWFEEDFGENTDDVQRYLAPYFEGAVQAKLQAAAYDVGYLDYDWTLNDQAEGQAAAAREE
ncbi:MAG: DUF547 domain-containing protein [Bacteroidetes bacterium]|jgi:hypothetical protein|nr:DUF547 domain-containing protein [Bacteroidota bacterium]